MSSVDRDMAPQVDGSGADEFLRQAVSALVDGELSSSELDELLGHGPDGLAWRSEWQTYHLIGDLLRGSEPALTARPADEAFAARMSARLREEPRPVLQEAAPAVLVRGAAANDAVFRWKLVAGVASLAAAAAVGWSLVDLGGAQTAIGPQIAMGSPAPVVAEAAQPVLVQTPQGQMVRDAQLEQLLSEHRQYGGMSALQMPAGFLRNATYDDAPQR